MRIEESIEPRGPDPTSGSAGVLPEGISESRKQIPQQAPGGGRAWQAEQRGPEKRRFDPP
jgi:hypothetical protein